MQIRLEIFGAVQGVGFRPFVFNLALEFGLFGEVYNDAEGAKIVLEGEKETIKAFICTMRLNLPPLARIDEIREFPSNLPKFSDFKITNSKFGTKFTPILPDFAICEDCKNEFYDPKNRRFHYPFINCTNCGPRLSIIKNLPYDRRNTTMREFSLCDECRAEYENPKNRRFHAEPVACAKCGPQIWLKDAEKNVIASGEEAVISCVREIQNGKIIAIKGIGGFHLVCDALNLDTLNRLRELKNRPFKPFAVMVKNLEMAREIAQISDAEAEFLNSNIKPIVLLKSNFTLPTAVAPNTDKIGIFIAPTGLHLLLFEHFAHPIIATSANLRGESIIFNEADLIKKLGGVFDFYLDNNREIITPSDDSVGFLAGKKRVFMRVSRGLAPMIIPSKFATKRAILALGAEMKNQFAIYKNGQIYISPFIGDLKNPDIEGRFLDTLEMFARNYDIKFDIVIGDLHPYFRHTRLFEKTGKVAKIQHHYAHLLSVLAEKNLKNERYLGFAFDGTGLGENSRIWGGEVMIFDKNSYKKIAGFDEFCLIGGESAIKNISKLAFSVLKKYNLPTDCLNLAPNEEKNLNLLYEKGVNPLTSSLGRIFDAFCALVCGLKSVSFDGEAGIRLEALYLEGCEESYKFEQENGVISYKSAFLGALKDEPNLAATKFINAVANFIFEFSQNYDFPVVLSGGVFQNLTLMRILTRKFDGAKNALYFNEKMPINDGNIALGQLEFALNNL